MRRGYVHYVCGPVIGVALGCASAPTSRPETQPPPSKEQAAVASADAASSSMTALTDAEYVAPPSSVTPLSVSVVLEHSANAVEDNPRQADVLKVRSRRECEPGSRAVLHLDASGKSRKALHSSLRTALFPNCPTERLSSLESELEPAATTPLPVQNGFTALLGLDW
ncbi:MAG: hypothetical protein HOW73_27465 [Polyangiaceae bacterium]|nr:hypothetical protein [Polyangiaceae bacterium]